MGGYYKMAERKPYVTKTRQVILEYMKEQSEVTVSVADIEKYLKEMGIKEYRLTSKEEPSDETLHELMSQVAESVRSSTENSNRVLQQKHRKR